MKVDVSEFNPTLHPLDNCFDFISRFLMTNLCSHEILMFTWLNWTNSVLPTHNSVPIKEKTNDYNAIMLISEAVETHE